MLCCEKYTILIQRISVRTDLLQLALAIDPKLDGLSAADYNLPVREKLNKVINRSWNRLLCVHELHDRALMCISQFQEESLKLREVSRKVITSLEEKSMYCLSAMEKYAGMPAD